MERNPTFFNESWRPYNGPGGADVNQTSKSSKDYLADYPNILGSDWALTGS